MIVASSVDVVPIGEWRLARSPLNRHNRTIINKLWEQLSIGDRNGVLLELVLVNLLSVRFAP